MVTSSITSTPKQFVTHTNTFKSGVYRRPICAILKKVSAVLRSGEMALFYSNVIPVSSYLPAVPFLAAYCGV
jgi:hypothetical protein